MNYKELLADLLKRDFETSWFEFKENWFEAKKIRKIHFCTIECCSNKPF